MPTQRNPSGVLGTSETEACIYTSTSKDTKPSIRVVDSQLGRVDLVVNRKDDLENGVLLRSMGLPPIGHETRIEDTDTDVLDSGPFTTSQPRISHSSETPALCCQASVTANAETAELTETSVGRSFSVPTDDGSSVFHQSENRHLNASLLAMMEEAPDQIPKLPSAESPRVSAAESKRTDTAAEISDTFLGIVLLRINFNWQQGRLMYGAEPLASGLSSRHSSDDNDTVACVDGSELDDDIATNYSGVEDSTEHCETCTSVVGGSYSSTSPGSQATPFQRAFHDERVAEILFKFRENIVEYLDDHYWRAHGPQRSSTGGEKSSRCDKENNPYATSYERGTTTVPSRNRQSNSRRTQLNGSGNSEDEEDSANDETRYPSTKRSKKNSRPVDCPFYKRHPPLFEGCSRAGFAKISHVKQHLRTKHQQTHCETCLKRLGPKQLATHICDHHRPQRVLFLTKDALARLSERADPKKSLAEQWLLLYKILFPYDRAPFPCPYARKQTYDNTERLQVFLQENRSAAWREVSRRWASNGIVAPRDLRKEFDAGLEAWLSRFANKWLSLGRDTIDERGAELDDLPTANSPPGQIPPRGNSPQLADSRHQSTNICSPSSQQPPHLAPYRSLSFGAEATDKGHWVNAPDQLANAGAEDFLSKITPGDDDLWPDPLATAGESDGLLPASGSADKEDSLLYQQSTLNTYSAQFDGPWCPQSVFNLANFNNWEPSINPALLSQGSTGIYSNWLDPPAHFVAANLVDPTTRESLAMCEAIKL